MSVLFSTCSCHVRILFTTMNLTLQFIYLATKWRGVKVVNKQNVSLLHTVYSLIIALKRAKHKSLCYNSLC